MEKRTLLAIVLSLLVLFSWSALVSKVSPPVRPSSTENATIVSPPAQEQRPEPEASPSSQFNFDQDKFTIIFDETKAMMKEVRFKDYGAYKFSLKNGFLLKDKTLVFKKDNNIIASGQQRFIYQDADKQITKRFNFHNSNYSIELDIEIKNLSNKPINMNLPLVLGVLNFTGDQNQTRYQDVTIVNKERPVHLNGHKDSVIHGLQFLGLRDRYFCVIIEPGSDNYTGFIKKINPQESEIGLSSPEFALAPGQQIGQKFHIYLGPQDLRVIKSIKPSWGAVVYYGTFDIISRLMLQLLDFLYSLVHNWGWAIIVFGIIIFILSYPLSLQQMRSMKEMQLLQPQMEELKKIYKDNPQKLNKEIMELYRQHKVNPLGGCLPLIVQIPIFFALYQALIRSVNLKGAHFLWIRDLSEPDRLFILPKHLPINEINILPILMAIGMLIQQKTSLINTSGGSKEQQKLMMIIFPIMFGFIFYRMPSGLVLYWFINSTLMLLYQLHIRRIK